MWIVSYLQWASLNPSSHSASLLWELVSTSSYWQLSFSIDFSHGSYLGQYFRKFFLGGQGGTNEKGVILVVPGFPFSGHSQDS